MTREAGRKTVRTVFDTRPDTGYDDDIFRRYHFPDVYLAKARKGVGDWVVYREPRRGGGREGYVAVARVARIEPDPKKPRSSYAHMTDFLPFDTIVPLHSGTEYYEAALNAVENPSLIGAWLRGKSIRNISAAEFAAIARAGLAQTLGAARAQGSERGDSRMDPSMVAFIRAPQEEQERRISQMLVNRPLRDAAFRTSVVDAYDEQCAVTGLRIINGGGRAEVQAAHIWPVADGGPGIVQNGIALSATCHWLFDRHLISLSDNYGLLVSHNRVPGELRNLFEKQVDRIHLPTDERLWPRPEFVIRHRERFAGHGP